MAGKQLLQKCLIGFALRGRMPAEQMFFSAVHTDVDVRRGGHAPLGIEVRDLEAANAVFVCEIDVARGLREIESIAFTVLSIWTSCTQRRSPPISVSSDGVSIGVKIVSMPR